MDEVILLSKIESLKKCISRIREKTPLSAGVLKEDLDCREIIILNLQRAVQVSVDIASLVLSDMEVTPPLTMAESFAALNEAGVTGPKTSERMRKAVGFRNLAVHEYNQINLDIVYSIISNHLDDFRTFAAEVVNWQKNNQTNCDK